MEEELQRLYDQTGETSVLPGTAPKYFTVAGERRDLSGEEYVTYATVRGQTAYNLLSDLVRNATYKSLDDAGKVQAIEKAYDYAADVAKAEILGTELPKSAQKLQSAGEYGISMSEYAALNVTTSGIDGLKDKNGETITNSKGLQIMEVVYETLPGLTRDQYQSIFEDLGVGKTVRGYSPNTVAARLKQMRKQATR